MSVFLKVKLKDQDPGSVVIDNVDVSDKTPLVIGQPGRDELTLTCGDQTLLHVCGQVDYVEIC